jgi:hypothetical protein
MPSVELLLSLRSALLREQEKRAKQRGWPLGDPRLALYQKLDAMAENRRRLDGELPRLSPAQLRDLGEYLAGVAARSTRVEDT